MESALAVNEPVVAVVQPEFVKEAKVTEEVASRRLFPWVSWTST